MSRSSRRRQTLSHTDIESFLSELDNSVPPMVVNQSSGCNDAGDKENAAPQLLNILVDGTEHTTSSFIVTKAPSAFETTVPQVEEDPLNNLMRKYAAMVRRK
jgi:hypothetical protein